LLLKDDFAYASRRSVTPLITLLKVVTEYLPENTVKVPADLSDLKILDKGFSVYSDPEYLCDVALFCLEAKCFYDLALQCLKDYITILTYFKEFNQTVDMGSTRKKVILMMCRCLLQLPSIGLDSAQTAKKFFEEVETSIRQDYMNRTPNASSQVKSNFDMLVLAKTEIELAERARK